MQVPVLTGSDLVKTSVEALEAARKVGYPVLLKATGGGGGMGIYKCFSDEDVMRQFESSKHQGKAFFDNDGVSLGVRKGGRDAQESRWGA